MSDSYYIEDWLVEPLLLRVSRNGKVKKMEPQLMKVLLELTLKSGKVVSKEDLRKTVWVDVIITDNVLTRAISSLRKVLEDDSNNPKYIETISKKGYRLIARVKQVEKLEAGRKSPNQTDWKANNHDCWGSIIISVRGFCH